MSILLKFVPWWWNSSQIYANAIVCHYGKLQALLHIVKGEICWVYQVGKSLNKCAIKAWRKTEWSTELSEKSLSQQHNITTTVANGFGRLCEQIRCCFDMFGVMRVDAFPSAGPSGGQAEGDVQADAGAAAAGREVPQTDGDGAGQREAQTRRLHG